MSGTDPKAMAARILNTATSDEQLAMAVDECGTGIYDDELTEIVQYPYEPGALRDYARGQGT